MAELEYITIEQFAEFEGLEESSIKKYINKPTKFNYLRFKKINGRLYVCCDFYAPFKNELAELKDKALIIAKNENNLCKELSLLSNGSIKQGTLQKYFYRFRFKQIEKAIEVMNLLKEFISKNSLFEESELTYD